MSLLMAFCAHCLSVFNRRSLQCKRLIYFIISFHFWNRHMQVATQSYCKRHQAKLSLGSYDHVSPQLAQWTAVAHGSNSVGTCGKETGIATWRH